MSNKDAVRQVRQPNLMGALPALVRKSLLVKAFVEFIGLQTALSCDIGYRRQVSVVFRSPALGTGAVSGGQRHSFINEEQLRVAPWCHDNPMAIFELGFADDPVRMSPARPAQLPVFVVQGTAVAHEKAPLWM